MVLKEIKNIFEYRQMIAGLVHRDLRGRYKGSILGFLWTFLNPLLQLLVYTLVFGILMKSNIPEFYLYLFVALIPWIFVSTCVTGGSTCMLDQKNLVTKIKFPREVIPISYVTSCFINMLYSFIIVFLTLAIAMIIRSWPYGMPVAPGTTADTVIRYSFLPWFCLPIYFIILYIFSLGICLLVSSITVYFRDMQHILGIVTMLWMFCTPIMYSLESILPDGRYEKYGWIFTYFNPLTTIVQGFQSILYKGAWPDFSKMWIGAVYAIVFFIIGVLVFSKLKKRFAEEM